MLDKWDTGTEVGYVEASELDSTIAGGTITVTQELMGAIEWMLREYSTLEWQMLLKGTDDGEFVKCDGYYIPKQEVSSATVKNIDDISSQFIRENNIVATIHSHVDMGISPSWTDIYDTFLTNIKAHVIINNRKETSAFRQWALPDGRKTLLKARFQLECAQPETLEGIERIEEGVSYDPHGRESMYEDVYSSPAIEGNWPFPKNNLTLGKVRKNSRRAKGL